MKVKSFIALLLFFAVAVLAACNSANQEKPEATAASTEPGLKIAYIDKDSLLRNYNLAKDLNEAMYRSNNKYESIAAQKEAEIRRFAQSVQTKIQSNGYLSEASYRADEQKLNEMQQNAQRTLGQMQQAMQNELLQNNIQLNDSVDNVIREYNKDKKFDIILDRAAALHIDPKFDITAEVIEGLNARYNRVEKK